METVLVQSCRGEDPLLRDIESILMHASGDLDKDLVGQLSQLRNIPMSTEERNGMTSFSDILKLLKKERALLRLLPQVVKLVKLVCILPCSTATPERSFSQLRRIKNYMRSTVTQERLNHTMIAAVHCDKLDERIYYAKRTSTCNVCKIAITCKQRSKARLQCLQNV